MLFIFALVVDIFSTGVDASHDFYTGFILVLFGWLKTNDFWMSFIYWFYSRFLQDLEILEYEVYAYN